MADQRLNSCYTTPRKEDWRAADMSVWVCVMYMYMYIDADLVGQLRQQHES